MNLKEYKYVIFDLDGTLVDTSEGILQAVEYTINKLELKQLDNDILRSFIGPPIEKSFENHCALDAVQAKEAASIFRKHYMDETLFMAKPYDGIFELCDELKKEGCKLAVATYKREKYAIDLLEHFGFEKYMDVMHGSDEAGVLTKADIIDLCVAEMDAKRDETCLVGDTQHDLIGASGARVKFVGVTYGFGYVLGEKIENDCCVAVVNSPLELLK